MVVTGANRGLGLEVARQCAARGDMVVLGSRDLAAGRRAAADLGDGVLPVALDVTDADGLAAAAADVDHAFGRVDVLVNNAAIHYDTWQNAVDVDLGVVREALETNVLGAWQTTLTFLPLLRRSAHPRVVMVSSEGGSLASMNGGVPATPSARPRSTPSPARWPATCAATPCSSTPSAPAGPPRIWAGAAAARSPRARRASCGPPTCRTTVRRAPSPATGGPAMVSTALVSIRTPAAPPPRRP